MGTRLAALAAWMAVVLAAQAATAAEVKVLTAGAFKQVLVALAPRYEQETGNKVVLENDPVGTLVKRIEGGEAFDLGVLTPAAIKELAAKGKFAAAGTSVARVGVGVVVKAGAPVPDISTVDAFKKSLLAARSVAYIDPAAGGSSGIYVAALLDRLGIAAEIKPKAKLKKGGYVADLVASGEAELGLHQISEILAVKGVHQVGPLPAEIQNYTTYAAAVGAQAQHAEAAQALLKRLTGPEAEPVLKERGMERPPS
jgi:molybdate transport system substrate-binding protein